MAVSLPKPWNADNQEEGNLREVLKGRFKVFATWLTSEMCRFPWSGFIDKFSPEGPPSILGVRSSWGLGRRPRETVIGKAMAEKQRGVSEGFFWIVIGGIICVLALQYGLGSFRAPAPGFVAFLSGVLIAGVGAVMIVSKGISGSHAKGTTRAAGSAFSAVFLSRLAYTMIFLIAYAILMEPLGYIVSTFLAMFGLFFDREKKNWLWSSFFSVTTSLVSYLVFEVWLHCQLPRGILPWW